MQELFSNAPQTVHSARVIYTASFFARSSLLYLQEIGYLKALRAHISKRSGLASYLCILVEEGAGTLEYGNQKYKLKVGDIVFIDCLKAYAHESSEEKLQKLRQCHFNSICMADIYKKYCERGGQPVFHAMKAEKYEALLKELQILADSQDYVRDMKINVILSQLLTLLMEDSWNPEKAPMMAKKRLELKAIKEYLDEHYTEKVTLDQLSKNII